MNTSYAPKALTKARLEQLCHDVKQALRALYGSRLDRVVLYGSYARGDFHAESDVDFLVVLHDETVKSGHEVWFMGDCIGELSHQYDLFISAKPTSAARFSFSDSIFYKAVRSQGKVL